MFMDGREGLHSSLKILAGVNKMSLIACFLLPLTYPGERVFHLFSAQGIYMAAAVTWKLNLISVVIIRLAALRGVKEINGVFALFARYGMYDRDHSHSLRGQSRKIRESHSMPRRNERFFIRRDGGADMARLVEPGCARSVPRFCSGGRIFVDMSDFPLEAINLEYRYPDGSAAVSDVSFTLREKEKIALIGANGSGKTTLLMLLAGCINPQKGKIYLRGRERAKGGESLGKNTGMLFQEPDDQLFMPTVAEDVSFGLVASGSNAREARAKAIASLEALASAHLAERPPHRMSSGEKRRAALAGILVTQPEILLLDEPTSGLDPVARVKLIEILENLDKSMIIATHDLNMAMDLCGTALILKDGAITARGQTGEILLNGCLMLNNGLRLPLGYE
jgi:cobalt/nickel transport system ATP-binding protein